MRLNKPGMMVEASETRIPKNIVVQVSIFIAVFIVIQIAMMIAAGVVLITDMISAIGDVADTSDADAIMDAFNAVLDSEKAIVIMLYATVIMTLLAIVYCKFIEKRPLSSMGFRKKQAAAHYFAGLGVGLVLFVVTYFICVAFGAIEISSVNFSSVSYGMLLVFFFGFVFQGMSEEVLLRGYFMNSIGGKSSIYIAIAVSSVAFSVIHGLNPGTSFLAYLNLALYGVLMAVYMICFDNIWGACGIHTMWNFAQGNIFGVLVSGMEFGDSIFKSTSAADKTLINGGDFGIEGGIVTTVVLCVSIVLLWVYNSKKAPAPVTGETP